jgi:EPS-associated MarR family transcriptional regulator
VLTDEFRYRILKLLEQRPSASQREIARELGISLGRVNFCVQALIEKGLVKVNNFQSSANKRAYLYVLTAKGIQDKARVTVRFLRRKLDEYEALKRQVEELQQEARRVEELAHRQVRDGALARSAARPVTARIALK